MDTDPMECQCTIPCRESENCLAIKRVVDSPLRPFSRHGKPDGRAGYRNRGADINVRTVGTVGESRSKTIDAASVTKDINAQVVRRILLKQHPFQGHARVGPCWYRVESGNPTRN